MILLDTNVVSESMRVEPDRRIIQWLDRQPASGLFISAITVDEITFGIAILPSGRRRRRLADVFARIMDIFAERTLSFDAAAAAESARFRAQRRLNGKPMSLADSQVAGVAKSNGFALATLDIQDFQGIDITTLEPR